jgi:hypothetical protein
MKLKVALLFAFLCASIYTTAQTVNANSVVLLDPTLGANSDNTALYRSDLAGDFTRVRFQLGDEESALFEMGYPYYSTGQWTNLFTVDGYGNGYFRGNVGINTAAPSSWFPGRVLEMVDTRPILKLSSSAPTGISTIVFTNTSINASTHLGEFHLNHVLNAASPELSKVGFGSYPSGSSLEIRADGHIAIQDNKQFRLRGLTAPEAAIAFDAPTETVRISNTKDTYDRFVALGGYTGTTWSQQVTLNTKSGNVGIGNSSPAHTLDVTGNLRSTDYILGNNYVSVVKSGSYRVSMNGQTHGYITGRNDSSIEKFLISSNGNTYFNGGNVGIGTSTPNEALTVNGKIYGKEVKVDLLVPGPDYVFEKNYELLSLDALKNYLDEHKHLPEVPSAKEMEKNGVNVGEMEMILLKKIEELTLYVIDLKQENKTMKSENEQLKKLILEKISALEKQR